MKPAPQPRNRKPSSGKHVPPPVTLPKAPWVRDAGDRGEPMADWIQEGLAALRAAKARVGKNPTGPRDALCLYPGCDRLVHRDSRTGVCRDHMHKAGCRCAQCGGKRGRDEAEIQEEGEE